MTLGTRWERCKLVCFALLLFSYGCEQASNVVTPEFPAEAQVEMRSFELINDDRRQAGLPPLVMDSEIAAVARRHSADMRDHNYFAHNDPDGKTPSNRLRNAGISFGTFGENIAHTSGINDPATKANAEFLADKSHRSVLLNPHFTRVGVGVVRSGNDYWITQDFVGQ